MYIRNYVYYVLIFYLPSINLLTCQLSTSVLNVMKAVQHVIKRVNETNHKSVLAMPLISIKSAVFNNIVEEAVKENITVVTPAGKKLHISD